MGMIKLPRTIHIEGSGVHWTKDDPDLKQFSELAGQFLVIEEKVDGSGVSLFFDEQLELQIWHRGSPANGKEFRQLHVWAKAHQENLFDLLEDRYVLFGEWMLHKHTIFYDQLPTFFLESDIYDRKGNVWLSTMARNAILSDHKYIRQVPVIASLKPSSLSQLTSLVGKSVYQSPDWGTNLWALCEKIGQPLDKVLAETDRSSLMEGLYIKHEDDRRVVGRYKYVRSDFINTIINSGSHLIDREPIHNMSVGDYWL